VGGCGAAVEGSRSRRSHGCQLAQAEAAGQLRRARLEAEDELRWEIARAAGGTQAEAKTAEATPAVSAAAAAAAAEAAAEAEAWVAPEMYTRDSAEALEHARRKARTYLLTMYPLAYVLTSQYSSLGRCARSAAARTSTNRRARPRPERRRVARWSRRMAGRNGLVARF
jgi:hypothetical protein